MLCARVTEKMASLKEGTNNTDTDTVTVYAAQALPLLHTLHPLRRTFFNRVFALVYACAILALVYRHAQTLLNCKNLASFSVTLSLLLADLILAFMWVATQSFHIRPVHRKEYPENLEKFLKPRDFPALDVFVCTADPYKEPPIDVVNTALSVMAYDYPTEKVSVYVSDDGGSALTLFAFMEAAKFASHWLPFCREKNIMVRSPEVYFSTSESNHPWCLETQKIKALYESMKFRVEHVVETGKVSDEYINGDEEREASKKWTDGFIREDHPTVIQVLSENSKDRDVTGHLLPNLVYVSRQKSKTSRHYFKAGALNTLLRVSTVMTNAPIVLTLDCDMYSNDPKTPLRVLCYACDSATRSDLAFVQFPQRFRGLNKNDLYACEIKRLFEINFLGFDGLRGPNYVGTGTFFRRRAFFGDPSSIWSPEIPQLHPNHAVDKSIRAPSVLSLAHHVAGCNYENQTYWGYKMGFRYGSLVEDYYTGYRMHCEGWRSIFCHPERSAFYGDAPICLVDLLNQNKRWAIGLLEVTFSRYSTLIFGIRRIGLMGLCYAYYSCWPFWSIPITVYAFLPQLALLNGVSLFPKVSEPWFLLYSFLFIGSYARDCLEFILEGATFRKWWNDQRIWMIRGLTCFLFGSFEYFLQSIGISAIGFNVTSKVLDGEQSKRYEQEIFEFGVPSPMFVTLATAAIINFLSFFKGFLDIISGTNMEGLFLQLLLSGFLMVNCLPIYEAMFLRSDKGKMPTRITLISTFLAGALYAAASLAF
ncbi:cellulose synthase-like protein G2 [Mangifera indica]|uniref:cellulose synthase-like protein G2 n=1 Tax=Mangifera indica TaxID=29780 RepID=UPI001CF9A372|nr:cellulose synthase-like protein G2 [Mangifera indica]